MTVVVLGLDALDPDVVDEGDHPHLTLDAWRPIETIVSDAGSPSTHELWPTIITGLPPDEHGLELDDGVSWGNPLLNYGSALAGYVLPDGLQSRIGDWLLNNVEVDTFRTPAEYYDRNGIETVFDGRDARAIGIPNYVTDPDEEDREHQLRKDLGGLFERDSESPGGHTSSDPVAFYELCMEMTMIRIARVRRALRSRQFELVFGYTSGLDLIGHVSWDRPALQERAYGEIDQFVSELEADLSPADELLVVSDHGLQDGVHTDEAMVAGTSGSLVAGIDSVLDVYDAVTSELERRDHRPEPPTASVEREAGAAEVEEHLEDLGYM